jgi:isoleucyl-tRNA synthetase
MATEVITHSYPHCWRHKTPVIYRAAAQWFVRMDEGDGIFTTDKAPQTLRQLALAAIEDTGFFPENGKGRLRDMIANRPDWCISRQRSWGVPLPFLLHVDTAEPHPRTPEIVDLAAQVVEQGGIEAWSKLTVADILARIADGSGPRQLHKKYRHPGSVVRLRHHPHHRAQRAATANAMPTATCCTPTTRAARPTCTWKATTSTAAGSTARCLTACAMYGRAPYKGLLTHGFTVDGKGLKMSKSLGNVVAPQTISEKMGAEIIRLWCASTDYSGDLGIDDKILARVVDAYRRIRNTLRFLLANISDFNPATDTVADADLLEIDRYALARAAQFQAEVLAHYEKYEFHPVVAKLQLYCSEDLGGFYLDVLKDRLYTTAPKSLARRSAQTALYQITQAFVRWMAPFLSFTAEEAWASWDSQMHRTANPSSWKPTPPGLPAW